MDNTKQLIGNKVKQYRKEKGLKQSELAELVGVEDKTISRIEVGGNYPSLDLLVRMAKALNKELIDFVNFEDKVTETITGFQPDEIAIIKRFIKTLSEKI